MEQSTEEPHSSISVRAMLPLDADRKELGEVGNAQMYYIDRHTSRLEPSKFFAHLEGLKQGTARLVEEVLDT